jgi:bis(5'-nucleosyl)-tetraphosphatase (symmetrical)
MTVYAIGDVQGCYDALQRLLQALRFDPLRDRLWFTGDLVNRGPESLAVLRFVKGLGDRAVTVLGNHDLTLLAHSRDHVAARERDTFQEILDAPDGQLLLDWLRYRPLLHRDSTLGFAMMHAGLPPQWDVQEAMIRAHEVEAVLRSDAHNAFLAQMFGNRPRRWSPDLSGYERLRFIVNCLTRIRFCSAEGSLSFKDKGPPGTQRNGYMPWFRVPGRRSTGEQIVFGHWAALGLHCEAGAFALDSACVWGGELSALRLDGPHDVTSVACRGC